MTQMYKNAQEALDKCELIWTELSQELDYVFEDEPSHVIKRIIYGRLHLEIDKNLCPACAFALQLAKGDEDKMCVNCPIWDVSDTDYLCEYGPESPYYTFAFELGRPAARRNAALKMVELIKEAKNFERNLLPLNSESGKEE